MTTLQESLAGKCSKCGGALTTHCVWCPVPDDEADVLPARLAWIVQNMRYNGKYRSETPLTLWHDLLEDDERAEWRRLWLDSEGI